MKSLVKILLSIGIAAILCSCASTKQIAYMQDLSNDSILKIQKSEIKAKVNDRLSIIVGSKDPQLALLFNKPAVNGVIGQPQEVSINTGHSVSAYTVDKNGYIEFPVLGEVHVAGLTKKEIEDKISNALVSQSLVNDAIITVEWLNNYATVLGEVNKPGRYIIDGNSTNIYNMLADAGDLTVYGQRKNVKILRTDDKGEQKTYAIDLTNGKNVASSPAYYIQPNDIIYVTPNRFRAGQASVNGNTVRSASFWISIASLLTSIGYWVFK